MSHALKKIAKTLSRVVKRDKQNRSHSEAKFQREIRKNYSCLTSRMSPSALVAVPAFEKLPSSSYV